MDVSRIPIEDMLPHRGGMLLLDGVLSFESKEVAAWATPRQDTWYAEAAGMPNRIGIELMAQAIAAHVCLRYRSEGRPPRPGVLLGSRKYRCAAAHFAFGERLVVRAAPSFQDDGGVAAYLCGIERAGAPLATATVMVYEPEDFAAFLRRKTQ
jgi:predicted hotdog family 3-hydroxylacyl-ACP dehydratase